MSKWKSVSTAPEGTVVETKIDDVKGVRNVGTLVRVGRLWFLPDRSVYVYYTPTHWRPVWQEIFEITVADPGGCDGELLKL